MKQFLWGALPYIAFTFFIVGTLVRFFYFERNWTTKPSEFLEKKQLAIANPLFHFGLACVIGGHVVGVLVPKAWTAMMGIDDHMYHEAQKPLNLMKLLIELTTQPGQLIVDPFMGSGTTCVAAKELSRNYIGMELDEEYFKIAEQRIMKEKNHE